MHESKRTELLGDSAEQRAVVQQWLEYRLTRLDHCCKDDVKIILKVRPCHFNESKGLKKNLRSVYDKTRYCC